MTAAIRESVTFLCGDRRLTGELGYPADSEPSFAALVLGPHPYMGGTMQNALVAAIADVLSEVGGLSLRFDYGGAGRSEGPPIDVAASMAAFWETGHAPEDGDRFADAATALDFLGSFALRPVCIVGYSFGASLAWRLALHESADVAGVALVSPTLTRHSFPPVCRQVGRLLVIHSTDDFCTPEPVVVEWIQSQPVAIEYSRRTGGNHFFRGAEREIGRVVATFAASLCPSLSGAAAC